MKQFSLVSFLNKSDFKKFLQLSELNNLNTIKNGKTQIIYKEFFLNRLELIKNKDNLFYTFLLENILEHHSFQESSEIIL